MDEELSKDESEVTKKQKTKTKKEPGNTFTCSKHDCICQGTLTTAKTLDGAVKFSLGRSEKGICYVLAI